MEAISAVSAPRTGIIDSAAGHARVMNDLSRSGLLSRERLGTYTLIAGYSGLTGECWTPQKTMARQLQCSVRTLQRDIDALIELGALIERPRRESIDGSKGRAYRLSDAWRARLVELHVTGVTRLPGQPKSQVTPSTESHVTGAESQVTSVTSLKRTGEKNPEKAVPVPAGGGERVAAAATTTPAPTAGRPIRADRRSRAAPTPSPTPSEPPANALKRPHNRPRTPSLSSPPTPCPDVIELTEQSYESALKMGFERETVELELDAFMTKARAKGWTYVDWKQAFRSWLLKKVEWARERGEPIQQHGGRRYETRNGAIPGRRDVAVGKPGAPVSEAAVLMAGDEGWSL